MTFFEWSVLGLLGFISLMLIAYWFEDSDQFRHKQLLGSLNNIHDQLDEIKRKIK